MNKTRIPWVLNPDGSQGYSLNSKTGCLNHKEGLCLDGGFPCYAYKLAHGRLKSRYLANQNYPTYVADGMRIKLFTEPETDPFYPRWWPERLSEPYFSRKPAGIFLDDMSDWMGSYWPREWTEAELQMMRDNPRHRIYTLTKQPQGLLQWSPFPDNCWVGMTITDESYGYSTALRSIQAKVKFISFEPLLGRIDFKHLNWIDWVIIGAQTRPYKPPKIEWVEEIILAADHAGVPVFLKDNLYDLFMSVPHSDLFWEDMSHLRQEMPG